MTREIITEDEYLKAFDICRRYKNQILREILDIQVQANDKTSLKLFLDLNLTNDFFKRKTKGSRLLKALRHLSLYSPNSFIEDISEIDFLRLNYVGKSTLTFFEEMKEHFEIK